MKLNAEQEKVKNLLKDTITLLCKNGLKYKNKFNVEATIGVTVDDSDVILMSMNELIESAADKSNEDLSSDDSDDQSQLGSSTKTSKRKRRKRKMKQATSEDSVEHYDSLSWSQGQSLPKKSTYEVLGSVEDDNDVDLLEIKTEPSLSMSCEAAFGDINTDHSYLLNPNQTNNPRASSTQARPKSDQFSNESTASTSTVQGGHSQSDQHSRSGTESLTLEATLLAGTSLVDLMKRDCEPPYPANVDKTKYVSRAELESILRRYVLKSEVKQMMNPQYTTTGAATQHSQPVKDVDLADSRAILKGIMEVHPKTIDAVRAGILHFFDVDTILKCTATPKDGSMFLDPAKFNLIASVGAELFNEPDVSKFRTNVLVKKYHIIRRTLQLSMSK